ncbi:Uncharacterized protein dnm_002360 [Desulfonema magnum]|uniref:Uncharacterized protein n=2 Tax=Desulfonema magnum TaxID=45655 RepID=A0A975BF42_9BACT|nr:Uncharacterized protein dnm_002360 [Desulfonema magnum]
MRRAGWGAQIRQNRGTWNWFHFAIPSATKLDDDNVDHYHAWLRGHINGKATITDVHIRHGGWHHDGTIIFRSQPNLSERVLNESFNLPDRRCTQPLVMSIRIEFEAGGQVVFTGAGARFEEHT